MKLRSITLRNVRRFTGEARIDGIEDGLNVLCERNEHGKSTLFDAVQALFFKPHGSRDRDVQALRPHAGGAPEVEIGVETPEGRFTVSKRWLSRPDARVTQNGRLIAQADAAEEWVGRLVGGGDGGPSGLVWVRQGMTGFAGGSRKEQEAAFETRRDLLSSVTGEVEAMTGGRRMDLALSRCREELALYVTDGGRARTGGPWKSAQERVATLEAGRARLAETAAALFDALALRKRARRALAELADPAAAADRKARLDLAAEAYRAAERHAEDVRTEADGVEHRRGAVEIALGRLAALRGALAERSEAESQAISAAAEAAAARTSHEAARAAIVEAEALLGGALASHKAAEQAFRSAQRRQLAREGAARRIDLAQRIDRAESARKEMEVAAAAAKLGPDAKALQQLEALAAEVTTAVLMRDATATQLMMTYAPDRDGAVLIDGSPLAGGRLLPVPRGARLAIAGVGELEVRSGAGNHDDASVEAAEKKLRKALDIHGAASLDAARPAVEARTSAQRRHGEARAVYESIAPGGIEKLRQALAAIPDMEEEGEAPAVPEAESELARCEEARVAAQGRRDAANGLLSDARSAAARTETAEASAQDRFRRAVAALDRLGEVTVEALSEEAGRTASALRTAEALLAEKRRAAPDLAAAEAALKRARSVEEEARAEIARLRPEIATLDERIARSSGDAVEERLAEADQELEAARAELLRVEREVEVLRRLKSALDAARTEARERYFRPVAAELEPLLQLLWPDAELTWRDETLLPETLVRDGQEEPIEILSGGTQEQVALMVRLAFARMLAKAGRHAPVILDDALVFTDDDRIERMFDALHRQAADLQILVFSCRQRAFRELGGRTLRLSQPAAMEDAA